MKISCPNCNASGNIPEHAIPHEGRFLNCPKCNHGFTVMKPKATTETYEVDACPACNYSTFGDDRFSTCPKCGVVIKAFVERQRQEKQKIKEQQLLKPIQARNELPEAPQDAVSPVSHVTDLIDNMHPVNLIGWGCALAALIILGMGIMNLLDYNPAALKTQISYQRDEQVSGWYVFTHYGLLPWLKTLYGLTLLVCSFFFLQHRLAALKWLSILLRTLFVFVPLYLIICFIAWIIQPISHAITGYLIEFINMVIMSALFCIPLFLVDNLLKDKRVVSVVKLPFSK